MADHPSVNVHSLRQKGQDRYVATLLGLLNGLFWGSPEGKLVAMKFDDTPLPGGGCGTMGGLLGFCVVDQAKVDTSAP